MIQAVLLIALGFLAASLMGVLVAPALWNRAYRLSRKRLEHTLPVTLSEMEAAKDQLRASYAVRIRRLEKALAGAKQKAAMQLVDNSRLQMQIAALKDQMAELDLQLSERRNAATVLEQTITKRFPELDREVAAVRAQLQERSYELEDLSNKLSRRTEELEAAERAAASYQDELERLHEAFEKNSADRTGRRVRRASQWSLDDYRSEYDRLNLELSRLRQQLARLQDRDAQQSSLIKEELQKLAELMLASAQPKAEVRAFERPEPGSKRAGPALRRERPQPWPMAPAGTQTAAQDSRKGLSKTGGAVGESQASPPNPAMAEIFSGLTDAALKLQSANGSHEPGGDGSQPPHRRSSLLREAAPGMAAQHDGPEIAKANGLEEESANRNGSGTAFQAAGLAVPEGEAQGQESAKEALGGDFPGLAGLQQGPEPSIEEEAGGPLPAPEEAAGASLLERLRGVARET